MNRPGPVLIVALAAVSLSACAGLRTTKKDAPIAAPPAVAAAPVPPADPVALKPVIAGTPAPKTCVPRTLAQAPRYPDSDAALRDAAGAADRYQLMAAGRLMRQKRLDELERVVAGCR